MNKHPPTHNFITCITPRMSYAPRVHKTNSKPNALDAKSKLFPPNRPLPCSHHMTTLKPTPSINRSMITPKKHKEGEKRAAVIYYHQKGQFWQGKEEAEQGRWKRGKEKEGKEEQALRSEAWFRCGEAHAEYHGGERDGKKEEENGGSSSRRSSTVVVEFQIATGCTRQGH